jgi:hypothetical protein
MVGPIIDLKAVRKLRSLSVELRRSAVFIYKFALFMARCISSYGNSSLGKKSLIRKENTALKIAHEPLLSLKPDFKQMSLLRFFGFIYLLFPPWFPHLPL